MSPQHGLGAAGSVRRQETMVLLTLAAVQFTHIVDFMIMMPLGAQFMRLFAIDPQRFGFLVSVYAIAAAVAGFVAAFHIDRFDRKRALLVLYAGFTIATVACGLAQSYLSLLLARTLAGTFGGVLGALILAIVADLVPYARRGAANAMVGASFSLASVIGVPVGLWLAEHSGWRSTFLAIGAVSVVMLAAAARLLPPQRAHLASPRPRSALGRLRDIFLHANHLLSFAFVVALMFAGFTVIPFIAPYFVTTVGLSEAQLPLLYLTGGLATLITSQVIGRLADRYGKKRVFISVAMLSTLPILLLTNLTVVPLALALAVSTLFFVLVTGRFGPAMALVSGSVEPRLRGSFMSFNASIQQLGAGFASLVSGLLVSRAADGTLRGFDRVGLLAVACTLLCAWLAWRIRIVPDGSTPAGRE